MKVYELMMSNRKALEAFCRMGIPWHYVRYLDAYNDIQALKRKGLKQESCIALVCDQYGISRTTAWRIMWAMERKVRNFPAK